MKSLPAAALAFAAVSAPFAHAWKTDPIREVDLNDPLPHQFWPGDQKGYNDCVNYPDSPSAMCQNVWINNISDWCLFAPPAVATIGDSERYEIAWCVHAGHGTRIMPPGTITGVSLVYTPEYVQMRGTGDLTKILVSPKNDGGGEVDPHAYDGKGNPIGGLVIAKQDGQQQQVVQWMSFISNSEFCFRACWNTDANAYGYCEHQFDEMGCDWNMPGNNKVGLFETCTGESDLPPGQYVLKNGTTSTWTQGHSPTPSAHPIAPSSNCVQQKTISYGTYPTSSHHSTKMATSTSKKQSATGHKSSSSKHHKATHHHKASPSKKPRATGHKKSPEHGSAHEERDGDL